MRYKRRKEERTVDLKNITGSGFVKKAPFLLKVLAFIFMIVPNIRFLWGISYTQITSDIHYFIIYGDVFRYLFCMCILALLGLIIFWVYILLKVELFEITISTPIQEVIKTEITGTGIAEEIGRYKELYDSGAITEEVFKKLKNKIIQ